MSTPPADLSNAIPDATQVAPQPQDDLLKQLETLAKEKSELEERNAAFRKGVDQNSAEKKKLEAEIARLRILAGEEAQAPEPSEPEHLTKSEFEKVRERDRFERDNASNFKLLNEEWKKFYEEKVSQGANPQEVLDLALFRSGVQRTSNDQAAVSAPMHGVDRTGGDLHGVPRETLDYYKRQPQYKDLKDEDLAKIIADVKRSNPNSNPAW